MGEKVKCPVCNGDGIERCDNPDHGLISALSFHDVGRIGCPCCGHDEKYRVRKFNQDLQKYVWNKCEYCDDGYLSPDRRLKIANDLGIEL